jgi:hypothetical protein
VCARTNASPGEAERGEPYPVAPRVWAALNRRLFYVLIVNGYMGRGGDFLKVLREEVMEALRNDKDFVICDEQTSLHLI